MHGSDLTGRPFSERHGALEALFLKEGLSAPLAIVPDHDQPPAGGHWHHRATVIATSDDDPMAITMISYALT